jgi:phospholipid/cholesterol/gamma-HCH transport system substrate-binding protein
MTRQIAGQAAPPTRGGSRQSEALNRLRHRLYGLVFLVVVALVAWLAIAFYDKAFTPVTLVNLDTQRAGLQLNTQADVKIRGLIVGDVRKISATPSGATLQLALDPGKVGLIPANVQARLLPKTLFGEKYVDLVTPPSPSPQHIAAGEVIPEDRSQQAIEIDQVLNDTLPVLQAVQPQYLSATLNAIATALQGRGPEISQNIQLTDNYLRKINTQLPMITHDIAALSSVAGTLSAAAPDILRILRDATYTSNTLVQNRTTLAGVLSQGTTTVQDTRKFVAANANHLIGVNIANVQALELVARYSPEVPCMIEALAKLEPRLEQAIGGNNRLNITLEIVKGRPPYQPGLDSPQFADHRGPACYGMPDNPPVPFPEYQVLDGTQNDKWYQGGKLPSSSSSGLGSAPVSGVPSSSAPSSGTQNGSSGGTGSGSGSHGGSAYGSAGTAAATSAATSANQGIGFISSPDDSGATTGLPALFGPAATSGDAGTATEKQTLDILLAPVLGEQSSQVPDIADLLYGPLARGQVVNAG